MLAKIILTADQIQEVTQLFRQSDWELEERSLVEDIENHIYSWTIKCTQDQMETIFVTIDIGRQDYTLIEEDGDNAEVDEVADHVHNMQLIQLRVTEEQAQAIREFAYAQGIEEVPVMHGDNQPAEHCVVIRPRNPDMVECEYCLCQPCVLHDNNRQAWWPQDNSEPAENNSGLRKNLYYKFWTMLYHRGVWDDERYIQRKRQATENIDRAIIRREIMPVCVLDRVREWLPNVQGQPYMGHKWI